MSYDHATLTVLTALIAGLICPPVVSFLKRENWSSQAKHAVSLLISGAAAGLGMAADHQINGAAFNVQWLLTTFAAVHGVSQVIYAMYFSDSALDQQLTHMGSSPEPVPTGPTPIPADHPAFLADPVAPAADPSVIEITSE